MNSPYMGKFMVTQAYKGSVHDGLDLTGIDSKEIHSTVTGTVTFAGWENPDNPLQGFGKYVQIRQSGSEDYYYFGHLSEIFVKVGQAVNVTDIIGIEGSTGHSTGSHCHYCVRRNGIKGSHRDISAISGIPNAEGVYDDGYRQSRRYSHSWSYEASEAVRQLQNILIAKGMDVNYEDILKDVKQRDYNDSHRDIAPLKPAKDSIMVNTTGNTLEQSVQLLIKIMKENM